MDCLENGLAEDVELFSPVTAQMLIWAMAGRAVCVLRSRCVLSFAIRAGFGCRGCSLNSNRSLQSNGEHTS